MHQENRPAGEPFPSTVWDHVRAAASDRETLGRLLGVYRGPLVEFLLRKGVPAADAEDAVHQFFADRVLGGSFLGRADEFRGRFRAYLRTALWHFWVDRRRSGAGARQAPDRAGPLTGGEAAEGGEAGEAFDVALALRLFSEAVRRLRESCRDRPDLWVVFEGRVLALVTGDRQVPYAELAARGFGTERQAANAFQTVQARFMRCWGKVLADQFGPEATDESDDLVAALGRAGPELLHALGAHLTEGLPGVTTTTGRSFPRELVAVLRLPPALSRDPSDLLRWALAAPVWIEHGHTQEGGSTQVRLTTGGEGVVLENLLDLFRHADPGVELLALVKDYAKALRADPEGVLPPEVASVVYYAAIAAALARYGERISDLDDHQLRAGLGWVVARPWVVDELRTLAQAAAEKLSD